MSDLAHKTIRPGSLNSYSYYHSNRQAVVPARPAAARAKPQPKKWLFAAVLAILAFGFIRGGGSLSQPSSSQEKPAAPPVIASAPAVTSAASPCRGNKLPKLIKASVSQRKEWACEGAKLVHTNAIITGLRGHPETETPVGTYKIYAKQTDTTLTGSDSRGSWRDPISYWMPFLDNQYGTYGFHDATWRNNSEFGKVSPDSDKASHGCLELPLNDAKWLYNWAEVGTVVTVEA
jgi:hypothetical protein